MELLIAILWYLQILFTNNIYTDAQVDQMINENQLLIDDIIVDEQLSHQIYYDFNEDNIIIDQPDWIEVWDKSDKGPIKE